MSIQILHEVFEDYVDAGLRFDPSRHELLPDGPWIEMARDVTRLPELFLYRHRETGRFVLAGWTHRNGSMRTCIELRSMSGPPGWLDTPDTPTCDYLRFMTRPTWVQAEERRQLLARHASDKETRKVDSQTERMDKARSLVRRGYVAEGKGIMKGTVPWIGEVEGGRDLTQVREDIKITAKVAEKA